MTVVLGEHGGGSARPPLAETTFDGDGYGDQYKMLTVLGRTAFGDGVTARRIYGSNVELVDYRQDPNRFPADKIPPSLLGSGLLLLSDMRIKGLPS